MDARQFDALTRSIDVLAPRRAALALLGAGLTALLTHVGIEDAEARRKKRKKKKKKCKGNTKKCGKTCVPKNGCCKNSECGPEQTCKKGSCVCPSGFLPCGDECIDEFLCCSDADCGGDILSCVDGACTCPDPSEIPCDADLCCDPATEVCAVVAGTCQAGGCPTSDYCVDDEFFSCNPECVCVTSVEDTSTCTEGAIPECIECTSDAECATALAEPAVCIPNGEFCDFCSGLSAFCVTDTCPSGAPLRARGTAVQSLANARQRRR